MTKAQKKKKALAKLLGEDSMYFRLHDKFITNPKNPHAATAEEWDEIETKQRANHPVAYFILHDVYYFLSAKKRRMSDAVWWVKYRTMKKHKYHLIDTKLEPGYYDTDTVLLHGNFAAFIDFIENDIGLKGVKWQRDYNKKMLDKKNWEDWERKHPAKTQARSLKMYQERYAHYTKMIELYHWWKTGRAKDWAKIDKMWDAHRALRKKHQKDYDDSKLSHAFSSKSYPGESKIINDIVEYEESLKQKDTDNLIALMRMRGLLWN